MLRHGFVLLRAAPLSASLTSGRLLCAAPAASASSTTPHRARRSLSLSHHGFNAAPSSLFTSSTCTSARTFVWSSWLLRAPFSTTPSENEKRRRFQQKAGNSLKLEDEAESAEEEEVKHKEKRAVEGSQVASDREGAVAKKGEADKSAAAAAAATASPADDGSRGTFVHLTEDETEIIRRVSMGERVETAEKESKEKARQTQDDSVSASSQLSTNDAAAEAKSRGSVVSSPSGSPASADRAKANSEETAASATSSFEASGAKPAAKPAIPLRQDGIRISEDASEIPVGRVVRKVWSYLWPRGELRIKALVAGSVSCVLLAKLLKVAVPFWFKSVVDLLAPAASTAEAVAAVGPFTVGVFGCVVAYGLCRITSSVTEELKTVLFAPVGGHASTKLAMEMFDKLHRLDLNYHLNRETGVLSKDLDRGSRAFWTLAYTLLFMIVPTAFEMGLVCFALNVQAGPQFIGVALIAVMSYVSWTFLVTNWRAKFRTRYNALDSRVGGLIVDSLLNYETVKYFGTEGYESQRIRNETTNMNKQLVILDQTVAVLNFGQQVIFVLASALSLYMATCGVLSGAMSVGDLVLVDALLMQLYMPLSFLGMIYREVQTSTQNMQAMIALLDQNSNVNNKSDAKEYKFADGTIELRNVTFEYKKELNRCVLKDLSLTIPGGKTVAFVGPSGSGKSTIFRLLFRFYDPSAGQVLLDGQSLDTLRLESVRKYIGVIPQDTVLFNESVKYNIRYGRMDATDAEVTAAAAAASLHDTIMRMGEGYDTSVGERGLKLSGGEKQRVSIARVVLADLPILLADEATSALDSTTELNVMDTLKNATGRSRPRTIILIAHRLTTVKEADIIFVLDGKGGLAEQGTHEELLRKGGLYSDMWLEQLRDRHKTATNRGAAKAKPNNDTSTSSSAHHG